MGAGFCFSVPKLLRQARADFRTVGGLRARGRAKLAQNGQTALAGPGLRPCYGLALASSGRSGSQQPGNLILILGYVVARRATALRPFID
jgi:hypothetical protein